jgi:3-deoxy-manno-octulosonate cytidylyltransferase (CMP-KDO synthetase)
VSKANVWVVIPARYGSSRLPGKPLLQIAGKPIFAHVVSRAVEVGIDPAKVVVATDDQRIIDRASSGIQAVMTSDQHESGSDRVLEAARKLLVEDDDLVVNLQGDEPFVPVELIQCLLEYAESSSFGISTVCVPMSDAAAFVNENAVKVVLGDKGRAIYFSRAGIPYARGELGGYGEAFRHVGIYCYRMSVLKRFCAMTPPSLENMEKLEQLRALYYGIDIGCIKYSGGVPDGVDTNDDYQQLLNQYGA